MRSLLTLVLVCFFCSKLCGQVFYVTDQTGKVHKVTITNGQLGPTEVITVCSGKATSIAFQRNVIYYNTDGKLLKKADLVNNALVNCTDLPPASFPIFTGLTIDKKGVLYLTLSGKTLYTYDPATNGPLITKGLLPDQPSADMVFYKDQLYVTTTKGIYKVNVQDPAKSQLVIPTGTDILGLAVISVSSTVNKAYAFSVKGAVTDVIEIDLDNYTIGNTIGSLPFYALDAASNVEDGSYVALDIDNIKTTPDCPTTGRGTVQVISNNANSNYRYTLGATTNSTGVFTGVSPGPYTVTVTNGADSKQTPITVDEFKFPKPPTRATTIDPKCLTKGLVAITADTDGDKYMIVFKGNRYPMNRNFELDAGTYHFDIENLSGCIVNSHEVTLTQQTCEIVLNDVKTEQDCNEPQKSTVTVLTTPGNDKYHYELDGGAPNTTGIFSGLTAGDHQLKITSDGGGVKEAPIRITDPSINDPKVTYVKTDAKCGVAASVKFDIAVSNMTGYTAMLGTVSYPIDKAILLSNSGEYTFRLMKPGGCLLKEEVIQISKQDCEVVFFPNTFTPNNDGVNDIFRPVQGTTADKLKFQIFNRLGTLIYTSANTKTGWDGSYQGKPAPAGVYYWMASYVNNEGSNTSRNGTITLIR